MKKEGSYSERRAKRRSVSLAQYFSSLTSEGCTPDISRVVAVLCKGCNAAAQAILESLNLVALERCEHAFEDRGADLARLLEPFVPLGGEAPAVGAAAVGMRPPLDPTLRLEAMEHGVHGLR